MLPYQKDGVPFTTVLDLCPCLDELLLLAPEVGKARAVAKGQVVASSSSSSSSAPPFSASSSLTQRAAPA